VRERLPSLRIANVTTSLTCWRTSWRYHPSLKNAEGCRRLAGASGWDQIIACGPAATLFSLKIPDLRNGADMLLPRYLPPTEGTGIKT
jgi:hypothetical protein